jgi:DNA-directed RNA polymerase I and III subunit RPAC2
MSESEIKNQDMDIEKNSSEGSEAEGQENISEEVERITPIGQASERQTSEPQKTVKINQKVGDRTCATYNFKGEDHTLGNLLRYSLIKNPDVEFCGYSITHPSENEMNLRLQTTGERSLSN